VVQEAVHASRAIDITDQVLKALEQAESAASR
jgi:Skp family chaperone for outer membrane proteins